MTLIDFRYKEFTSIVTAFAVAPTQRGRSIGLEGCSQPRELWFSDILMYVEVYRHCIYMCMYIHYYHVHVYHTGTGAVL